MTLVQAVTHHGAVKPCPAAKGHTGTDQQIQLLISDLDFRNSYSGDLVPRLRGFSRLKLFKADCGEAENELDSGQHLRKTQIRLLEEKSF